MGLLRSEPMKHGTIVLPIDRAREFIDLIGEKTNMQFEDMNSRDMQRPYKKFIQRIDEIERILRFLLDEINRLPGANVVKDKLDDFLAHSNDYKLDDIEFRLKRVYGEFVEFKENNSNLVSKRNAALEERFVVQAACAHQIDHQLIGRSQATREESGDQFEYAATRHLLDDDSDRLPGAATMFSNIAGVIPQEEQDRFSRALFRATRGNTFTHFQHIPEPLTDPKSGKAVIKAVFVIYFQDQRIGSSPSAMAERVRRICNIFGVNTYRWPSSAAAAEARYSSLQGQVDEEKELLRAHEGFTLDAAQTLLDCPRLGANSLIEEWRLFCLKEKAIYASLNMFEGQMNLRAHCWYPADEEDQIRSLLIQHSSRQQGTSSAMLLSDRGLPKKTPPTYIRVNEFTFATQTLINLYGMPRYQEANPVLFSVVTFPFLFGVMYGDVGHGLLLFIFGVYLVWKAEDFKLSIPFLYQARYMIAMMGFFGTYAGFLYNDFFSVGMDLFGSRWSYRGDETAVSHEFEADYDVLNEGGPGPYPFGMDPVWHGASNELMMANSLKMKISVILGVCQMIVGLLLRFANAIHERNCVDFCCECIPMMIFMVCFFGFMDYMIMYKWVNAMDDPPSIINSLIAMGMWGVDPSPMFGMKVPRLLMSLSMITVPWMLIPKPLILNRRMKSAHAKAARARSSGGSGSVVACGLNEELPLNDHGQEEEDDEEHGIGEIVIHQVIETIEYVLGTVSHTASYLRLWALSLAHQQLSFVFFQKTILMGMSMSAPFNIIGVYILFAMWFMITLAVLMGMDVMECVLHVLRLHWIEFQSKFYKADGYLFAPYRHALICKGDDDAM